MHFHASLCEEIFENSMKKPYEESKKDLRQDRLVKYNNVTSYLNDINQVIYHSSA